MRSEVFLMILGMAAITYVLRFAPLVALRRITFPERFTKTLRFIPIAVLSTLIVPAILMPQGSLHLSYDNSYLIAAIVTVIVAYKTKKMIFAILAGILVIFLLRLVFGFV